MWHREVHNTMVYVAYVANGETR